MNRKSNCEYAKVVYPHKNLENQRNVSVSEHSDREI